MTKKRYNSLSIEPKNAKQREFLNSVSDYPVTFAIGSAGGGKTYLATFKAIEYLQYGLVDKIVVVRPAVATEDLGYLPGDLIEKIDPYLLPIWDAFESLVGIERFEDYKQNRQIEIAALAFMRGRTISNAFIILDEAQNTTIDQMKMFLTRFGENVKVVITGDPSQSDINGANGLEWAVEKLQECKSVNMIKYTKREVVRSALTRDILHHLEKSNDKKSTSIPDSTLDPVRNVRSTVISEFN